VTPVQREALLRILSGPETEPAATIFNVFASTLEKFYQPIFSKIDFQIAIEARGEPILNRLTDKAYRVRIDTVGGFEYKLAEIGRSWARTMKLIAL
jgi:hypothetical protein